MRISFK